MEEKVSAFGMFPGQGSQKIGMGKNYYDSSSLAQDIFHTADEILGFKLSSICFNGPIEELTKTEIAQPAILTVSFISYLIHKDKYNIIGAAGHSLGEYSALVASEAISFDEAVSIVHNRGIYMQKSAPEDGGKMIAILGKELFEIENCLHNITDGIVDIANINAPGQIVLAGNTEGIQQVKNNLKGAKIIELNVSAPFHCRLMKHAEELLTKDLQKITFSKPKFPVYANASASEVYTEAEILEALKSQVCSPVRWVEIIEKFFNKNNNIKSCVEFGYGNVLSNLVKRINPTLQLLQN